MLRELRGDGVLDVVSAHDSISFGQTAGNRCDELVERGSPFDALARLGIDGANRDSGVGGEWLLRIERAGVGEQPGDVGGGVVDCFGIGSPVLVERVVVNVELLRAGGEHCVAGSVGANDSESGEFVFDLGASLREVLDDPTGDARNVGNVVVDRVPLDAETARQLVAQYALVHRSGGQLRAVEGLAVECGPLAVGPASQVRNEDMGVQMRVASTARSVPEPRSDEPDTRESSRTELLERSRLRLTIVRPATDETGFSFEPTDRFFDGDVGGLDDLGTHERIPKCIEHTHRLRSRERQVETRDTVLPRLDLVTVRGQPGPGVEASKDGSKLITGDLVVKIEGVVGESEPAATSFAGAGVVVVDAVGDLAEVVLLGTHTELP